MNGTTIPTGRDNTYSSAEITSDIQTGRNVYADKDRYESDDAYKARIDEYVRQGFRLTFGTPDEPSSGEGGSEGGGGTSGPLEVPLTYNGYGRFTFGKTFGEIRTAWESGRPIYICNEYSDEVSRHGVDSIEYFITPSSATCTVIVKSMEYAAYVNDAPYTLEALDALYPYISD